MVPNETTIPTTALQVNEPRRRELRRVWWICRTSEPPCSRCHPQLQEQRAKHTMVELLSASQQAGFNRKRLPISCTTHYGTPQQQNDNDGCETFVKSTTNCANRMAISRARQYGCNAESSSSPACSWRVSLPTDPMYLHAAKQQPIGARKVECNVAQASKLFV